MPIRCYLFKYTLGEVYRWYEEREDGAVRLLLSLGEYKEHHWRMRPVDHDHGFAPPSWLDNLVAVGRAVRLG